MAYKFNALTGQFDIVGVTVLPPGTGDVMGPGSSTPGNIAAFSDASGKVLEDSGLTVEGLQTYTQVFNAATSWTGPTSGSYILTVPFSSHAKTAPIVQLFEASGANYIQVEAGIRVDAANNVIVTVNSSPDLRFVGKIVIS